MKMYSSDCKCLYLIIFVLIIVYIDEMNAEGESISTPEPEPSIGCPIPDLRLSRPKMFTVTTEPPIETTEVYSPEDFTTGDTDYIENLESMEDLSKNIQRQTRYTDFNPYAWSDSDDGGQSTKIDDHHYDEILHSTHQMPHYKQQNIKNVRRKPRKNSSGRRRLDRHNQGHKQVKRDIKLIPSNTTIYFLNPSNNLFNLNQLYEYIKTNNVFYGLVNKSNHNYRSHTHHRKQKIRLAEKITNEHIEEELNFGLKNKSRDLDHMENFNNSENANILDEKLKEDTGNSTRVKRKSGKTTGALRPKTGSETSSKTPSRKKEGGNLDEEGGHFIHVTEDSEDSEESEESESSEGPHFDEVTEVRFPGEVGPLGDRRLCKIRCVKGKWVGPLCAINEEDENGQLRFQPLYKSCLVNRIQPHILLSYRNISVNVGWDLPHGHSLQARCKDLGLYKLLGETRVLCSNGLWAPRMPSCVPTTLLTNYSDDSPPSIRIKIGIGSGAFEPSGVLAVLPDSTVHLDCMYPRRRGTPEWTTTGWFRSYYIGWSNVAEEKSTKFRLTINDIETRDSGTYTCTSPRGLTNSIVIIVAMSNCPQHPDPVPPLNLRLEGLKLGQRALYTCPLGYTIEGAPNSTCLASGNWSSPTPTCQSVQCPPLFLEDPHLSLTELNASAWGRAVFKCSWGYRLSGPPGLECEPSGIWSGAVPRCKAIQCLQPLIPINGRIDGTSGLASHRRYAVGALVTFSCTEGHLLEGEASIVCTETGVWSHPAPFCKPQCVYPGDPPNGLIAPLKFHYDPGDFLSVQCRPGFIEYGSNGPPERPKCLSGGNWSGPVPQCKNYADM